MTKNSEGMRSVHFPEAPRNSVSSPSAPHTPKELNVIEQFADALRDSELIRSRLRGLLTSDSRHGDLQASLSAALRLADKLRALIENEERS